MPRLGMSRKPSRSAALGFGKGMTSLSAMIYSVGYRDEGLEISVGG